MDRQERTDHSGRTSLGDKWWIGLRQKQLTSVYHRGHSGVLAIERSAISFTPTAESGVWLSFDSISKVELIQKEGREEPRAPSPPSLSSWKKGYTSTGATAVLLGVPVLPTLVVKAARRHNQKQRAILAATRHQAAAPPPQPSGRLRIVSNGELYTFRHDNGKLFVRNFGPLVERWDQTHPAAPQSLPAQAPVSVADELRKLADLRDAGILTDAEFESQKTKLLAR